MVQFQFFFCILMILLHVIFFPVINVHAQAAGYYDGNNECQPCYDGGTEQQQQQQQQQPTELDFDDDDDECIGLITASKLLQRGTFECSSSQLYNYQKGCGCDKPPHGFCTLCPDGGNYDPTIIVPNLDPDANDLTCADLTQNDKYMDFIFQPGLCEDTFLQRGAAWCGCYGHEKRQCTLCPDGSKPPNPNIVDPVYYQWSCDIFDYVSSFFSQQECGQNLAENILEFDAAAYCGCPGTTTPQICDLCPEGTEIVNPDLMLGDDDDYTCRQLALSTWYIPSHTPCLRVLEGHKSKGYIDKCCGVPTNYNYGSSTTTALPSTPSSSSMLLFLMMMATLSMILLLPL